MSRPRAPAVGIDLGTTYSVIARLDEQGRPVTLANAEGDLTTPSAVLLDGNEVVVGKEALKALSTEAASVAHGVKREMGERLFSQTVDGRQFPPEVLQALVLKKLVEDARQQIGPFNQVVITVPAYFDEVRRKATQEAGYLAGIDVLDIINEPTAAAVAFGFQQGFLSQQGEAHSPQNILVYDLGGGTFDVTVMSLTGREFRALATDGDVHLGGYDWDQRIFDHVAGEFIRQFGVDPRDDVAARGRLWREADEAKRTLTARKKAVVSLQHQGHVLATEITRELFQELTQDLLSRTEFTTRQTLKAAGLDWGSIDRVLLVGGSTRMPAVVEMLRNLSGKQPDASVSADEAVAHGAALHAGLLISDRAGQSPQFSIRNVNSHSLGVVGTDPHSGMKRNAVVIARNTPLPVTSKRVFKTQQKGQKSILVQVIEGESSSPEACTAIGQCAVRELPPGLPAGTAIEVLFHYSADGRLKIKVRVAETAVELKHEIERVTGLSKAELDAWRERIESGSLDGI